MRFDSLIPQKPVDPVELHRRNPERYILSGGGVIDVEKRRRDIEEFDRLGPLTREVIRTSPIDLDIPKLLAAFRQQPRGMVDPDAPGYTAPAPLDERQAEFLVKAIQTKAPGYQPLPEPRRVLRTPLSRAVRGR